MTPTSAAAGTPNAPTAKLMTRLERYTSTMPMAMSAMISPRMHPMATRFGVSSEPSTSAPLAAEEHGPHEIVAVEQLVGIALVPHLALLEEDGAVRDRQRDVERLLDDQHRLTACLQLLDRLEQTLHDDGRQPE